MFPGVKRDPDSDGSMDKVHIISQKCPPFATKKFRMQSLLWNKPVDKSALRLKMTSSQLLPTLLTNLASLSIGFSVGFSAVVLPQLPSLYDRSSSWIASIFGLGAVFGGLVSSRISEKVGKRRSLLAISLPDLIGWILMGFARNVPMMLVGRFLCGFAAAGYLPTTQMYIYEMAQPHHRLRLSGASMPVMCLGTILAYCSGAGLNWRYVAAIGAVWPLLLMACLVLILDDSPYWHMRQGDHRKALQVLSKYRPANSNLYSELLIISSSMNNSEQPDVAPSSIRQELARLISPPVLLINWLFLLRQLTGHYVFCFYLVDVVLNISSGPDEYMVAVMLASVKLVGSLLHWLANQAPKSCPAWLMISSSSCLMGASLVGLGLSAQGHYLIDWLPLLCLGLYMFASPWALSSMPRLALSPERQPDDYQPVSCSLTMALSNLELFVLLKTFPDLILSLGLGGTFWLFAAFCFLMSFTALLIIPRMKTLDPEQKVLPSQVSAASSDP